jgi:hypothetical protein
MKQFMAKFLALNLIPPLSWRAHRGLIRFAVSAWLVLTAIPASAGFIEIGASGSYRKTNIDVDAYDESFSYTGSIGYCLSEASAIELSYTNGQDTRAISDTIQNAHVTYLYYQTAGADFVYTFGAKESAFRPYLKAGVVYILSKEIVDQYRLPDGTYFPALTLSDATGLAPSAGFGFRIAVTDSLSFKIGVDGWSSRPLSDPPITFDWFGRAGLSWLF